MHKQDSLAPSEFGVLFVSGFASSLRVQRGQLLVKTTIGREVVEARFTRIARPRIRRVLVFGSGGYATWEALAWIDGIGASFAHVTRSGRIVATSGHPGPDLPALRRAQVLATDNVAGPTVVRYLLGRKLEGQAAVLHESFASEHAAIEVVEHACDRVMRTASVQEALAWEAKAAAAYWRAWASCPIGFIRGDVSRVPAHWLTAGDRHSPLSSSPRLAATPVGALLNFLYTLAEFECRLALLAIGFDPGIGWAHRDTPYRDSAALDLLETIRPDVDRYIVRLLEEHTFSRKDFVELPTGQVRLSTDLAGLLASSTLVLWERSIGSDAEEVARLIAASAASPVKVRTRLTQADRKRGRVGSKRQGTKMLPSACRICALVLEDPERMYCDDCLPVYESERTEKLAAAGEAALRAMRSSADDPARSPQALAKRAETSRTRMLAVRAWERQYGKVVDRERYERKVFPAIQSLTVPALMATTGLSQHYCWQVRSGRKRLHQMHWEAIEAMANRRAHGASEDPSN